MILKALEEGRKRMPSADYAMMLRYLRADIAKEIADVDEVPPPEDDIYGPGTEFGTRLL